MYACMFVLRTFYSCVCVCFVCLRVCVFASVFVYKSYKEMSICKCVLCMHVFVLNFVAFFPTSLHL